MKTPFLVTIPHSGEQVPTECTWLHNLPETLLMYDVDRYVDILYQPAIEKLQIPFVKTQWHRYAADLNRIPEDIDAASVEGSKNPVGTHPRGFHWSITTMNETLMPKPMSQVLHQKLVDLVYSPFHKNIEEIYSQIKTEANQSFNTQNNSVAEVYHLDLHSMPSRGTNQHRDPGQDRADFVVSDVKGASAKASFKDLVIYAYERQGFKVAYNWPYLGGRVTEQYGNPSKGHHTIQVEMNRKLYMNEQTKKLNTTGITDLQQKLTLALEYIIDNIPCN